MIHVELGPAETTLGAAGDPKLTTAALALKLFSDNDGVACAGAN